jgi:TRAP-type C4-dicarboxylate transport system permease small subunit
MAARLAYQRAMEWVYVACIAVSGVALVVITLIIPFGVFMRYALNRPLGWPEPASVIMMVIFSFVGAAAVYRANGHIAVEAVLKSVGPGARRWMERGIDGFMVATALFMVGYGIQLCLATRFSTMAEFPEVSQGLVYLPIPLGGLLTLLFVIEKVWVGPPPTTSVIHRDGAAELE